MSFLNDSITNDLSCRFNKITGDQFFIKDETSGDYVPFLPGSGASGEVPNWVKNTNAEFTSGVSRDVIDHLGVKVEKTDSNSYSRLNYSSLNIIEKPNLSARLSSMTNSSFFVGYHDEGSINADLTKASATVQPGVVTLTPQTLGVQNETGKYKVNEFTYRKDGVDYTFDLNVLKDVLKLYNKTALATPSSDNKMVLYNPTTQDYNYSEIPSGSGTSYPYLLSNKILMNSTDGTKTITLDQETSTISSSKTDGNNYVKLIGTFSAIEIKAGVLTKSLNWEDITLTNSLKHLVGATTYIQRTTDRANNEYLKYNSGTKTFNREKVFNLIIDATTQLVQLQDPVVNEPRRHPTTVFAGGAATTTKINEWFEKLLLSVNNLIYNRWYIIDLGDEGIMDNNIITMEKTSLNNGATKSHDGELIFLRCQNAISGYAAAVGKIIFKVICPDITNTSTTTSYTFLITRITNSRTAWPTITTTTV